MEPTKRVQLSPTAHLSEKDRGRTASWSAYSELTKPRLSLLSVITALVGYLAALPAQNLALMLCFIAGTALCAAGAATLNQWMERDVDALMKRTRERPLPADAITPAAALAVGLSLSLVGILLLGFGANTLAGALGLATVAAYILVYTPLKPRTRWATEIGAIPGALPPLIGWAAAEGGVSSLGWVLFGVLLFWQIPHFMAIAWTFRDDYAAAGFPMLTVVDRSGRKAARWATANSAALLLVSVSPFLLGLSTWVYASVAALFGAWILWHSISFTRHQDKDLAARKLFLNSILYLPAVLFALVLDRWIFF